jgi:hypothetical protein
MTLAAQSNYLIRDIKRLKFKVRIESKIDYIYYILEKEERWPIFGCVSALCKLAAERLELRRTQGKLPITMTFKRLRL